MTDKEKIRAEVEKMYEVVTNDYSLEGVASAAQLHKILVFIDSLSEEPVSKDLEEAAKRYARERSIEPDFPVYNEEYEVKLAYEEGAQWQKVLMINRACALVVNCIEDFMARHMETWHEESKKATVNSIRKVMEEEK